VKGEERQMVHLAEAPDNIGVGFWVAPEVPSERLAALRTAFQDMVHDAQFLAEATKLRTPIDPVEASTLQNIVAELYTTPPAVVDRFKNLMAPKH
jgi:tripartite-type tricarboxylate transporter receptor subunit TctC